MTTGGDANAAIATRWDATPRARLDRQHLDPEAGVEMEFAFCLHAEVVLCSVGPSGFGGNPLAEVARPHAR